LVPDTSTGSITLAFNVLQIIIQGASVLLWFFAARDLTRPQRLLGFAGLFLTFEALKEVHFAVVGVDPTAIFLSLAMLAARRNLRLVALLSVVCSFTWQMGTLTGAMILGLTPSERQPLRIPMWIFWASLLIGVIGFCVFSFVSCPPLPFLSGRLGSPDFLCHVGRAVFTGLPAWTLFLVAAGRLLPLGRIRNVVASALVIVAPAAVAHLIANPTKTAGGTISLLAEMTITPSEGFFLLPVLSIAVFWGPMALLALLRWSRVADVARAENLAAPLLLGLLLALPTEPRYVTFAWPILIYCSVKAYPDVSLRWSLGFAALSLVVSKVWFPLTLTPWPNSEGPTSEFPFQYLFMNKGYWMISSTFWLQALIALGIFAVLYRRAPRVDSPG
jgi:hypothetical protein